MMRLRPANRSGALVATIAGGWLVLFVSGFSGRADPSRTAPSKNSGEWWFDSTAPDGTCLDYDVEFKGALTPVFGKPSPRESRTTFALCMERKPGVEGYGVRLEQTHVANDSTGEAGLWMALVDFLASQGMHVTDRSLNVYDRPALRGPWRKGDRMSAGGVIVLFGVAVNVLHADVLEADDKTVKLSVEFWSQSRSAAVDGRGRVTLHRDETGITEADAEWTWSQPGSRGQASFTLRRLAVRTRAAESTGGTKPKAP